MSAMINLRPRVQPAVGFDELFDGLNDAGTATGDAAWPPYNIVKTGADDYEVVLAGVGLRDELSESMKTATSSSPAKKLKARNLNHISPGHCVDLVP